MSTPTASRLANVLARQHRIDLRALDKGVYVVSAQDVLAYLDSQAPTRSVAQRRAPLFVPHTAKIRAYQWECVRQMCDRSGFVIAPCGCGKTLIGLLVAVLNGGRFMVLTTRYAEQWKKTLDDFFTPIDGEVNIVVDNHLRPGVVPDVLISTYSAFCPNSERLRLAKHLVYDTVVLDEAHCAASSANLAALDRLHAMRWCALTATLVREDSELSKLEARVGPVIAEVGRIRLIRERFIPDVEIVNVVVPYDDVHSLEAHIGRHKALALHPNKIQALVHTLRVLSSERHKTIVFCDDLFCLAWTSAIVKATGLPCIGSISMNTPIDVRGAIIEQFERNANATIVFISRTGDEALDVPSASAGVVFWNHWASRRQIVQRVGRISRMRGDKAPVFITLLADHIREHAASKHREAYMQEHGFVVRTELLANSPYATPLHSAVPYIAKLKTRYTQCK